MLERIKNLEAFENRKEEVINKISGDVEEKEDKNEEASPLLITAENIEKIILLGQGRKRRRSSEASTIALTPPLYDDDLTPPASPAPLSRSSSGTLFSNGRKQETQAEILSELQEDRVVCDKKLNRIASN
jgi:hypothetical protein